MSTRQLEDELERLRKENEELKAQRVKGEISLKVSAKGAVSLYGLGRFPVTLYVGQWQRIFERQDQIKAFIIENADKLSTKP